MKTLSYTSMHFTVAFAVTWTLTGDLLVGGLVALVEPAINSVAYVFHEKAWAKYGEGHRDSVPESGLMARPPPVS